MPTTRSVQKIASNSSNISGFQRTRYEKLEKAFGIIPTGSYAVGDTLQFVAVPSSKIISATFKAGSNILLVYPDTSLASPLALATSSGSQISYQIEYMIGYAGDVENANLIQILTS